MTNHNPVALEEVLLAREQQMWSAFARGDSQAFANLVDPQALMIVGGIRMSGARYAQEIAGTRLDHFALRNAVVLDLGPGAAAIHYMVDVAGGPGAEDLTGTYRVSSVWQQKEGRWVLVLNHDSVAV